jgi:gamma-glutamyltranspeptidase / glutathione hydrolase
VTVPGAVAGWGALLRRFGRCGLDACLADAIDAAENGAAVGARAAALWSADEPCPPGVGPPAPRAGEVVTLPELAGSLRLIADDGPGAVYAGPVAEAIASATWLTEEDLGSYEPRWTAPLRGGYRRHEVIEMPPPTQGVVALEALALLEACEPLEDGAPALPDMIRCVELALEDGARHVRDGAAVDHLLDPAFLRARGAEEASPVPAIDAGTVHLCVIDSDRLAVSFIQSLFGSFGSGVVAPGTGIVLQNRGACFAVGGAVRPGERPFHTIIPALLTGPDGLVGAFGVVGGHLQPQAHVQLVSAIVDRGLDPQAALDEPRFRVEESRVLLEDGLWPVAGELRELGYEPVCSTDWMWFGSGQVVLAKDGALLGGSDPRMDGYAAGF